MVRDSITSKTIVIVFKIFVLLSIIALFLVALLFKGINIEKVTLNNIKANNIFLKIDNKLVVNVEEILISPTKKSDEQNKQQLELEFVNIFEKIFFSLYLIEEIVVDRFIIGENEYFFSFKKSLFYLKNRDGFIQARVGWISPNISYEIEKIYLNEYNITAYGKGFLDYQNKKYSGKLDLLSSFGSVSLDFNGDKNRLNGHAYHGNVAYESINGNFFSDYKIEFDPLTIIAIGDAKALEISSSFEIIYMNNNLSIKAKDAHSNSLEKLSKILPLDKEIQNWIHGYTKAENYYLKDLEIRFDEKFNFLLDKFYLNAIFSNATISFNKMLEPVKVENGSIEIKNNFLNISSQSAKYRDKSLDLKVKIGSFVSDDIKLSINLVSSSMFDIEIKKILKEYGVDLGILQLSGRNFNNIDLDIGLLQPYLSINVESFIQNAQIDLYGVPIYLQNADILIDNDEVFLKNVEASYRDNLDILIDGAIDIKNNKFDANAQIFKLQLLDPLFLDINDLYTDLNISWENEIKIDIAKLNSKLLIKDKKVVLKIDSLVDLIKYSKILEHFGIDNGAVSINGDATKYDIDFMVDTNESLFIDNSTSLEKLDGKLKYDQGVVDLYLNDKVSANIENDKINLSLNNIDINLTKLFSFLEKDKKFKQENKNEKTIQKLSLFGNNSSLIYKDRIVKSDWYSLNLDGKFGELELNKNDSTITVSRNGNDITIRGRNLDKDFTNSFAKLNMLEGKWSTISYANLETNDLYGVIKIEDATVNKARFITNLIAIVNTIPALIQLKNPGFSDEGFTVKRGLIEFYLSKNKLFFNAIRLIGSNTDIVGQGSVDLNTEEVDLVFNIKTIKGLSSLIGKIPLVGYILLDDDKSIGTTVKVTGTIDNPKIDDNVAKDIIFYPFQIIKRTILLPFKLFEDDDIEKVNNFSQKN